jgi:hypothetical protein
MLCAILIAPGPAPLGMGGPQTNSQDTTHHTQHVPTPDMNMDKTPDTTLTPKQKQALMKSNFEKTKDDASELADLASGLRDELNKTSINVLSVDVIHKAEKIEKLARKIREEAKGY